jgi:hypothetical protein
MSDSEDEDKDEENEVSHDVKEKWHSTFRKPAFYYGVLDTKSNFSGRNYG